MTHSARRLNALSKRLDARRYLEIGVNKGETFRHIEMPERTAIDPNFHFDTRELENEYTRFVSAPSDDFFSTEPSFPPYDIVFIDGLHTFEQVVRDLTNVVMRTHRRSAILIDDTLPNNIYSAVPDHSSANRYKALAKVDDPSWHGDVFKVVFFIHDFWPALNYRTVTGSGNPQTIVWRANGISRKPLFNNLEKISRLTYFDVLDNLDVMKRASEAEAIDLCASEIN
jgi:hypothetical protein